MELVEEKRMRPKALPILLVGSLHFQLGWIATFFAFDLGTGENRVPKVRAPS